MGSDVKSATKMGNSKQNGENTQFIFVKEHCPRASSTMKTRCIDTTVDKILPDNMTGISVCIYTLIKSNYCLKLN